MKVWLKLATCCALMLGAQAHAQNKNVTLVIPYPPGGAADQLARVISQEMGTRFDQKVIVENRPGAGAQVAMNVVKNANPNALGTVLFLADSGAYSLNRHMYQRLNYDVATDLIPMTLAAKAPVFLLVNKDSPFKTVQDLVAAGQKQELTYGSPGMGTGTHLLGEMLRKETGARLVHVPYKGAGPALIDAVSGQIDFIFDVLTGSRGFWRMVVCARLPLPRQNVARCVLIRPPLLKAVFPMWLLRSGGVSRPRQAPLPMR